MGLHNNYYISSFFWSTFQKVLNAIVGFISVPLLLECYGKAEYGILGIATACNGYMHLLDLGMNTGAIKFFSQWRTEGKMELVDHVARTNITFYGIVSIINIIGLLVLAIWGEGLFSVTHDQFLLLRSCLIIIAVFSAFSWGATTFNQLLIANMKMTFTMQIQTVITILKGVLIGMVLIFHISLIHYFFWLTGIVSLLVIPYAIKCRKMNIIHSLRPGLYYKEFRVVVLFSLSIFALSLFQMTATQSRPIILSIFANDGAGTVAEFRIIEVIPQLIIMIGGTFTSIFLPKTSSMVTTGNQTEISGFAYNWTKYTSIIVNVLTMPFILCSVEVLSAYVGKDYSYLSVWLVLWCATVLIQMHTTPGNALVLAYGKTRMLVITTGVACFVSIFLNVLLTPYYGVGGAVISYLFYVMVVIGLYYMDYYKKLLKLSRLKMMESFLWPTFLSIIVLLLIFQIPLSFENLYVGNERLTWVFICVVKTLLWLIVYIISLFAFKLVSIRELRK